MNLLSNAVNFTESGEVVLRIISSQHATHNTQHVEGQEGNRVSRFTFEVIDTGAGIPLEEQSAIFEPFIQSKSRSGDRSHTKKEGTGLGLTIAKRYVELMEGKLAVESPPLNPPQFGGEIKGGEGSLFFFTIPLSPLNGDATDEPTSRAVDYIKADSRTVPARLADGYQVKALVADDTQDNRDVLSQILSDIGVSVITAENGQQALEAVHAEQPDIVFMDIRMPVMDGLEATQQILKECGESPPKLVAVSASALVHERQGYFEAGFDDFIAKPVQMEQVYECLAKLLHIEYEYEDAEMPPIHLSKIVLPEALIQDIKAAAEVYGTTELMRYLDEVEQFGEDGRRLAEHLRELNQKSDMEAILNIISKVGKS